MKRSYVVWTIAIALVSGSSLAYASFGNPRAGEIVEFFDGHTHKGDITIDAPQHSGGTDKYGCHNGSKPYHCH